MVKAEEIMAMYTKSRRYYVPSWRHDVIEVDLIRTFLFSKLIKEY